MFSRLALESIQSPIQGLFLWGWSCWGVKLTTHLQLVPRSWILGSIHPLLHAPSWHSVYWVKHRDNFTFSCIELNQMRMFCCTVVGVEKVVTVTKHECKPEEFECQPGSCIPGKWKCDGQKVKHISAYWFWCWKWKHVIIAVVLFIVYAVKCPLKVSFVHQTE
jgi:hypothetical protein